MDNFKLLADLVEASTKPILNEKNYWRKSILNVLKSKKEEAKDINAYDLQLKADIVYIKTLWKKQLDTIDFWAKRSELPSVVEVSNALSDLENQSKTEVVDGKVVLKTGEPLNKDELNLIQRYDSMDNLNSRIEFMEQEYLHCRISDNILLNVYQFLWENGELAAEVLRGYSNEAIEKTIYLISRCADECIKVDVCAE